MAKFHSFFISIGLIILSGCPANEIPTDGLKPKAKASLKRGDLKGVIDAQLDPPSCPTCDKSTPNWHRQRATRSTDKHMVAEFGNLGCLDNKNRNTAIHSLSIKLSKANFEEKRAVSDIGSTIIAIAGKERARQLIGGVKINFKDYLRPRTDGNCLPGNWGITTDGAIDMARRCNPRSKDSNRRFTKQDIQSGLIHEMAHYAGGRDALYSKYNRSIYRKCRISKYCTHSRKEKAHNSRNEEFAEVFSAFIHATDKLKSQCPKAYKFMRDEVFKTKDRSCRSRR